MAMSRKGLQSDTLGMTEVFSEALYQDLTNDGSSLPLSVASGLRRYSKHKDGKQPYEYIQFDTAKVCYEILTIRRHRVSLQRSIANFQGPPRQKAHQDLILLSYLRQAGTAKRKEGSLT